MSAFLGLGLWRQAAFFAALGVISCQSPGASRSAEQPPARSTTTLSPAGPAASTELKGEPDAKTEPVALLELFTSEGCSSCPAADETLALLTDEAARRGERVFTLELHVDYWNDLGWADPFSDHAYSLRQNAYARQMSSSRVYTPQLVVNGHDELVGSDRSGARAAIARALRAPTRAGVSVSARRVDGAIELSYRVATAAPVQLQLAVADDVAVTRVTAGENSDRLLKHRHVVRAFRSLALQASGSGTWVAPWRHASADAAAFVAVYATDPQTLQVLGADAQLLPGPA